jgi:hypothetical protein
MSRAVANFTVNFRFLFRKKTGLPCRQPRFDDESVVYTNFISANT